MHQQPAGRAAGPGPGTGAAAEPRPRVPPGHYAAAGHPFFRPPEHHEAADRPFFRPPPTAPPEHHRPAADAEAGTDRRRVVLPSSRPPLGGPPPAERPVPVPEVSPAPPPHRPRAPPSALASCLAATAFLLLSAGGAGAALFLLFRPRPPDIAVAAVRLPAFAAANGTVAFTFQQTAAVRNPNRSPLAHFDSSLRVAYAGGELGSVYIPAGLIDGGRTKDMSASFDVPAIPVAAQPQMGGAAQDEQQAPPLVIEVDSLLVVKGRVTVLRVLTHRVQAAKVCRVGVSPLDGRVVGFRC